MLNESLRNSADNKALRVVSALNGLTEAEQVRELALLVALLTSASKDEREAAKAEVRRLRK